MSNPPTRLARRLGAGDAIVMGLGSMIGASVFAAVVLVTAINLRGITRTARATRVTVTLVT